MDDSTDIYAVLRRWRYVIGVLIVLAVVAAGMWAVNRFADVERYRPAIIAALERGTGMHASVGKMSVRLLPTPGISVYDLALEQGESRLLVRHVTASIRLAGLAERRIVISGITLSDVALVLPKDLTTLRELATHFSQPEATSPPSSASMPNLDIDAFHIRHAVVRQGEGGPVWATLDGVANTLMADTVPLRVTAALPVLGPDTHLVLQGVLSPRNGLGGRGELSLEQVDLGLLTNRSEWTGAYANLKVAVDASDSKRVSAEISGTSVGAHCEPLNGSLSATAWWQEGALTVNDVKWASSGVSLAGDLTWNPPRQLACRINGARLETAALTALCDLLHDSPLRVKPRKKAFVALQDVMIGIDETRKPRIAQGTADLQGFDVVSSEGKRLLSNLYAGIGVEDGVVKVNKLTAEGIGLTGVVRPDWPSRSAAIEASGVITFAPAWLSLVPAALPIQDLEGQCVIDRVSATIRPGEGIPHDLSIKGSVKDVSTTLVLPGLTRPLPIRNLKGGLEYTDGTITLDNVAAEGVSASGTLHPQDSGIVTNLRGTVSLAKAPLDVFIPRDRLSGWGGTLTIEAFKATLKNKGLPADLQLVAGIEDGDLALTAGGYADKFSNVTAHVTASPESIKFDVEMHSAKMGALTANGGYLAKTGAIQGVAAIDTEQCVSPWLKSDDDRQKWLPLIQSLGPSTFRVETKWPSSDKDEVVVNLTRDGQPPCDATMMLARKEGKWALGEMEGAITLSLDLVRPFMPTAIEAVGNVALRARQLRDAPRLKVEADLTDVDAVLGDYLNKKRGDRLAAVCELDPKAGMSVNEIHVVYGALDIPVRIHEGGAYVDNIDLDLASLAGLLPKQGTAHGHVRGSFGTKPLAATLDVDGIGAFVAPEMGIDKITGKVTVHGTRVALQDVHAQGLDSDCTFNAEMIDGVFHGRANGSRLNLNEVIRFVDHLKDYKKNPKPEDESKPWKPSPFACELQVTLDTLIYRKGAAQEVSGVFSMHDEVVRATNLAATPYRGKLTGSIEVDPSHRKVPGRVALDFATQDADLRFVDETVFDKPRGLAGTVTGMVSMSILTGTNIDAIEGTNGGFTLDAQNGSLGEVAFATELRNLLKTTTLVRLRLPEYGKDSLGFDRLHTNVAMKDGVWTIQDANMQNPYLSMVAEGMIDFPHRNTDVRLRINFLESVTGLLGRIPLLGTAITKVGGMTGLDLQAYDTPYNMKVRLNPTQRLENAGKKAGEVIETITKPFRKE